MLARAKWDRPCGQNSAEHVHNNLSSLNRGAAESGCGGQCAVQERKERQPKGLSMAAGAGAKKMRLDQRGGTPHLPGQSGASGRE